MSNVSQLRKRPKWSCQRREAADRFVVDVVGIDGQPVNSYSKQPTDAEIGAAHQAACLMAEVPAIVDLLTECLAHVGSEELRARIARIVTYANKDSASLVQTRTVAWCDDDGNMHFADADE